ncbi:MAG: hypothetical protein J6X18_10735 [Bacteroidales bacterium]|nr:hypothetical protein [Bacteroidales bacterium]
MKSLNYRGRNMDRLNRSRRFRKNVVKPVAVEEVTVAEPIVEVEEVAPIEEVVEEVTFEPLPEIEEPVEEPKKKVSKPRGKKATESKETTEDNEKTASQD